VIRADIGQGDRDDDRPDAGFVGHWEALTRLHLRGPRGLPFVLAPLGRVGELEVAAFAVIDDMPASGEALRAAADAAERKAELGQVSADVSRATTEWATTLRRWDAGPRSEVLIVVEGSAGQAGVVRAAGRSLPLEAGSVAALPPGSRDVLRALGDDPLVGLLVRGPAREPVPHEPRVIGFDDLWRGEAVHDLLRRRELARLPGLSLHAFEARGPAPLGDSSSPGSSREFLPPHTHRDRDAFLLFLQGQGAVGLGTSGHVVREGSVALVRRESVHHYECTDPQGAQVLAVFSGPEGDPLAEVARDVARKVQEARQGAR